MASILLEASETNNNYGFEWCDSEEDYWKKIIKFQAWRLVDLAEALWIEDRKLSEWLKFTRWAIKQIEEAWES